MISAEIKPNAQQQYCIENINGKYLVLAGPGTGKTFTVIQRIKKILESGIPPEKILCLTFTDAAANEMKIRLDSALEKSSSMVNIYTYHGFCYEILENYPEEFELPPNFKVITESVSRAFIKECIDEIKPVYFRTDKNDPYFYIDTLKNRIDDIKKNRLTKEQYFENIKKNPDWEPNLEKLKLELEEKVKKGDTRTVTLISNIERAEKKINQAEELWKFYELYREKALKNRYLDFNDMISLVLDKFEKDSAFLQTVSDDYEYLLVDEYQDTNKAQNSIVIYLTRALKSRNVFVVGDDEQIIYTFQGAKLDTIENFIKEFPDVKVVCLDENMRSTPTILEISRLIANQDKNRLENNENFAQYNINKNLKSVNPEIISKDKPVRWCAYSDKMQEYNNIAEEIESLINSPECPKDNKGNRKLSEIAILTRSNAELDEFAEIMKSRNIPFELKKGKDIFLIPAVNTLYFYLQLLVNPEMYSQRGFQLLLSKPFSINPKDFQVIYECRSKYKTFIEVLNTIPEDKLLEPEKIRKFTEDYKYLKEYKNHENIKNVVLTVGAKTGILDYYVNTDINSTENIAGLKKFIDEAFAFSDIYKTSLLEEFINYLNLMNSDGIAILTDKAPVVMNAVQLSTYYSAKGREFEYVYMPTLISEKWESERLMPASVPLDISEYKTHDELQDLKFSDRIKVLYVGMTRAKHTLRLSYPMMINGKVKKPSIFITNIQNSLENITAEDYNETTYWYEASKALIKRDYDYKTEFCSLVDKSLENRAFSPTSVNMYLKCPRQFLYSYILDLNPKDGNPDNMSYGSAVHEACEFAVKYALDNGTYPDKDLFIKNFKDALADLPLSSYEQRENIVGRGVKALDKFYNQLVSTPVKNLYCAESPVNFEMSGVKFFGIIDRIDKNDDGTYSIYDYKTGNSKNAIMISPDGEYESYYNQMGLYKYFYEKSTGNKVKDTVFIYPEDFTNNCRIEYTQSDCEEISEKFKRVIGMIRNYEFEPSYKPEACRYCLHADFCNTEYV